MDGNLLYRIEFGTGGRMGERERRNVKMETGNRIGVKGDVGLTSERMGGSDICGHGGKWRMSVNLEETSAREGQG
jgi:hypothetical protein